MILLEKIWRHKSAINMFGQVSEILGNNPSHLQKFECSYTCALERFSIDHFRHFLHFAFISYWIRPQLQSSSTEIDAWSTGNEMPHNQTLLTLKVTGRRCNTKLRTRLPARPPFVGNFLHKKYEDIQRRFVFEADPNFSTNRDKFSNGTYYRYCQLDKTCNDDAVVTVFLTMRIFVLWTHCTENTLCVGNIDQNEKFHFCSIKVSYIAKDCFSIGSPLK